MLDDLKTNHPEDNGPIPPPVEDVPPLRRVSRSAWLIAGLLSLLSLCLSVGLTLSILGLTNGGLSYASRSKAVVLESQLAGIFVRLDQQDRDLEALRTRLQTLESLNVRLADVEQESQSLTLELQQRTDQIDKLRDEVQKLQSALEKAAGQSKDFETFLQGLAELMAKIKSVPEVQP